MMLNYGDELMIRREVFAAAAGLFGWAIAGYIIGYITG